MQTQNIQNIPNVNSLHEFFSNYGWCISTINMNDEKHSKHITYINPGHDLDFFDICFYENNSKTVVTIPVKGSIYQYKCTFYDYVEAFDYIERQFYDYVKSAS